MKGCCPPSKATPDAKSWFPCVLCRSKAKAPSLTSFGGFVVLNVKGGDNVACDGHGGPAAVESRDEDIFPELDSLQEGDL